MNFTVFVIQFRMNAISIINAANAQWHENIAWRISRDPRVVKAERVFCEDQDIVDKLSRLATTAQQPAVFFFPRDANAMWRDVSPIITFTKQHPHLRVAVVWSEPAAFWTEEQIAANCARELTADSSAATQDRMRRSAEAFRREEQRRANNCQLMRQARTELLNLVLLRDHDRLFPQLSLAKQIRLTWEETCRWEETVDNSRWINRVLGVSASKANSKS